MLTLALMAGAQASVAGCRQALALGLDVSGSVDAAEYQLQMQGVANALLHPSVQAALLSQPGTWVELLVYEWSGPQDQYLVLNWTALPDAKAISEAAAHLRRTQRVGGDPSTALGAAVLFGVAQLQQRSACGQKTLDISGDGPANTGPLPQAVRQDVRLADVTVNGLVIAEAGLQPGLRHPASAEELREYFEANVLHGPDAFSELALGFDAYEATMVRKLIRELQPLQLVALPPLRGPERRAN